jgi:hypothetical protein
MSAQDSLHPARFDERFPHFSSLLALLITQGKSAEAWELELRLEARIDWELEQEAIHRAS